MKVSIWQQFSSNHSADFTIIGRFETVEQAQQAEATLRKLFLQIQDWITENPVEAAYYRNNSSNPSPVEEKFSAQYNIDWKPSLLEWLLSRYEYGGIQDALGRYENLIFINEHTTWSGGAPLYELLSKLGAEVLAKGEKFDTWFHSTVIITARTILKAVDIYTAIKRTRSEYYKIRPWFDFVQTYDDLDKSVLLSALYQDLDYWRVRRAIKDRHKLGDVQTEVMTRITQREWDDLVLRAHLNQAPDDPLVMRAIELYHGIGLHGSIIRNSNQTRIEACSFNDMSIGFPAFIEWLKSQNCEVTYTFEEVSY